MLADFLSHFHSDHYTGLTDSFSAGTLYCSPMTGRLICSQLGVKASAVRTLELGVAHELPALGLRVTLLDANHCPGAVMFVFTFAQSGLNVLHTGDFRWDAASMSQHAALRSVKIDTVFLDTTYCHQKWKFPSQVLPRLVFRSLHIVCIRSSTLSWPQEESIAYVLDRVRDHLDDTEVLPRVRLTCVWDACRAEIGFPTSADLSR